MLPRISLVLILFFLVACLYSTAAQVASNTSLVELAPIDVDPKQPERTRFGALTLLSAFHLRSKDNRFGGLSGLSIGADGKLYAISDRGYWLSAGMQMDANGRISNLIDWRIAPMLTTTNKPVRRRLRDAEALAQTRDGSFLVAFEGVHRIWRYPPPPRTFESNPSLVQFPSIGSRLPSNSGIEALTVLADGQVLALTEGFENPDGSFKGWLIDNGQSAELSYVPADGFRVTDCAALENGDLLVLERRYVPFGILS
ncbi:MAG TPA: esterase-like activity of phytase family protein, partial [Candidatus Binatia bacterium]|nr:esterase-like activity of phytase family protein [Candidatus Binatia bacterium]